MGSAETRTVLARIDPDLMPLADFHDESLRLAAFRYSAQVVAGSKPSFRYLEDTTTHETQQ